ncbi:uncharacterized protein LOC114713703 [Neltuma alba]|uniref:uncharacterized protein LOC114713703 n=1 Tax=Neltuma alba TaxID=207710 RepID=UPI0010A44B5C|nr:uncharacterized protein LOC114713703 [Prosopis alba]
MQWSSSVRLYIMGKGKYGYLIGSVQKPAEGDEKYPTWEAENSMVQAWLINSMTTEISAHFTFFQTAKEVWDAARDMFAALKNKAAILEIERFLHDFKKGSLSITQYYTDLVIQWQQLDMYESYDWKCTGDAALYAKIKEEKRVFKFLLGLDDRFEEVRGRIMGLSTLPPLREVFFTVRNEESRKRLTSTELRNEPSQPNALMSKGGPQDDSRKQSKWCDHCRKRGHTREVCWKLHGKPLKKGRQDGRGFVGTTDNKKEPEFSKEELNLLRKFLEKHDAQETTLAAGYVAHTGSEAREDDWHS